MANTGGCCLLFDGCCRSNSGQPSHHKLDTKRASAFSPMFNWSDLADPGPADSHYWRPLFGFDRSQTPKSGQSHLPSLIRPYELLCVPNSAKRNGNTNSFGQRAKDMVMQVTRKNWRDAALRIMKELSLFSSLCIAQFIVWRTLRRKRKVDAFGLERLWLVYTEAETRK